MTEHNYSAIWRDKGFRLYEPDDDGEYRLEIDETPDRPAAAVWLTLEDLRAFVASVKDGLASSP